jgi:hypothetical protein
MNDSNKLNDLNIHSNIKEWNDEVEEILRRICEQAQIYRLLHISCHNIFKKRYYFLTIPIIILSSLTGSANLALGSFSNESDNKITNLVIGVFGIMITIISTLNNFFNFQSRKIEHYNSSKNWFKLERLIEIELSLQRDKRNDANNFFHLILQELERIHNNQPNIRTDVINKFLKKYKRLEGDKKKSINLDLPEIIKLRKITVVSNIDRCSSNPINDNNISDIKTNLSKSNFTPVINNEIESEESSGNGLNIII